MEINFIVGDVVKSTSGHDKNRLFIVTGIDKSGYLVIIDGKYRGKEKQKLKNPKHVEFVSHDDDLLKKVNSSIVTNAEIYKLIKAYKNIKE